jgi:hypothetical protein
MHSLVEMFCDVDDFFQDFLRNFEQGILSSSIKRHRCIEDEPGNVFDT